MTTDGFIDAEDIQVDADGSIEIFASQKPKDKNWLQLGPETNAINVRQTFQNRADEEVAEIYIERSDNPTDGPEPLSAVRLEKALQGTLQGLRVLSEQSAGTSGGFRRGLGSLRSKSG